MAFIIGNRFRKSSFIYNPARLHSFDSVATGFGVIVIATLISVEYQNFIVLCFDCTSCLKHLLAIVVEKIAIYLIFFWQSEVLCHFLRLFGVELQNLEPQFIDLRYGT